MGEDPKIMGGSLKWGGSLKAKGPPQNLPETLLEQLGGGGP